jgi:hypothetical protein
LLRGIAPDLLFGPDPGCGKMHNHGFEGIWPRGLAILKGRDGLGLLNQTLFSCIFNRVGIQLISYIMRGDKYDETGFSAIWNLNNSNSLSY